MGSRPVSPACADCRHLWLIRGGRGHLSQRVLMSAPAARGVLFDQQHVVEQASCLRSDRLALQAGDFFKGGLPVCDAYLLMEVIHGWNDEAATKILRNVRSAAPAHSKLLIIEAIIAEDPGLSWPKTLDLWMLAIGGKQRRFAVLIRPAYEWS